MQFYKLTSRAMLAIAATAGLQAATHASTKYDFITKQVEGQVDQPQAIQLLPQAATQPTSSAKALSTNQVGQPFFSRPPQLIRAVAFPNGAYTSATYEFTLTVPEDAGQPLKAVKITQARNFANLKFDISNSKAFIGKQVKGGSEIRLANIGSDQPANPGEVTIVFDQAVQPGNAVTVALAAQSNPSGGGVYLFGVTAYPAGESGLGQFLGYGRINFYSTSN